MLLYIIFQDCSLRRTCCKYFWGVADCTHHGSHFIQLWCTYAGTLLKHGQIVTPGAFYARAWVYFMTTLLCRDLFSLNMFGLLYTPGELYASMHVRSCDLKGGGGDREVWLSSYFMQTLPRRKFRLMQTKPGHFLMWFYLLVLSLQWTFVPVASIALCFIYMFYPFYVYWSMYHFMLK